MSTTIKKLAPLPEVQKNEFVAYTAEDFFVNTDKKFAILDQFTANTVADLVNAYYQKPFFRQKYLPIQGVLEEYDAAIVVFDSGDNKYLVKRASGYYTKSNPEARLAAENLSLITVVCRNKKNLPYLQDRWLQIKDPTEFVLPDIVLRFPCHNQKALSRRVCDMLTAESYALRAIDRLQELSHEEGAKKFHSLNQTMLNDMVDMANNDELDVETVQDFFETWIIDEKIAKLNFVGLKEQLPEKAFILFLQDILKIGLRFLGVSVPDKRIDSGLQDSATAQREAFLEEFTYNSLKQSSERHPEFYKFEERISSNKLGHVQLMQSFPHEADLYDIKNTAYKQFGEIKEMLAVAFHEKYRQDTPEGSRPISLFIHGRESDVFDAFLNQLSARFETFLMQHSIVSGLTEHLNSTGSGAVIAVFEDGFDDALMELSKRMDMPALASVGTYYELFSRIAHITNCEQINRLMEPIVSSGDNNWLGRKLKLYDLETYSTLFPYTLDKRIGLNKIVLDSQDDLDSKAIDSALSESFDGGILPSNHRPITCLVVGVPQTKVQCRVFGRLCNHLNKSSGLTLCYVPKGQSALVERCQSFLQSYVEEFKDVPDGVLESYINYLGIAENKQKLLLKNNTKFVDSGTSVESSLSNKPLIDRVVLLQGSWDRPEKIGFMVGHRPIIRDDVIKILDCILGKAQDERFASILDAIHELSTSSSAERKALVAFYSDPMKHHAAGVLMEEQDEKKKSLYMYAEQIAAEKQEFYTQKLVYALRRGRGLYVPFIAYYPQNSGSPPLHRMLNGGHPRILDQFFADAPQIAFLLPAAIPIAQAQLSGVMEPCYVVYSGMQDPFYKNSTSMEWVDAKSFFELQDRLSREAVDGVVIAGEMYFKTDNSGNYYATDTNRWHWPMKDISAVFFDRLSRNFAAQQGDWRNRIIVANTQPFGYGSAYETIDVFGDKKILFL